LGWKCWRWNNGIVVDLGSTDVVEWQNSVEIKMRVGERDRGKNQGSLAAQLYLNMERAKRLAKISVHT
jgi:hypothetical protein